MSCIPGPKVTVKKQTVTRIADGYGGYTETWGDIETFSAVLASMSWTEKQLYDKETAVNMFTLYCDSLKANRTARSFTIADRIVYGSRVFEIVGVDNPFQLNQVIQLSLREVV